MGVAAEPIRKRENSVFLCLPLGPILVLTGWAMPSHTGKGYQLSQFTNSSANLFCKHAAGTLINTVIF
jgi:hypothetical protein